MRLKPRLDLGQQRRLVGCLGQLEGLLGRGDGSWVLRRGAPPCVGEPQGGVHLECVVGLDDLERRHHLLGRDDSVVEINQRGKILRIPRDTVIEVRLITPEG